MIPLPYTGNVLRVGVCAGHHGWLRLVVGTLALGGGVSLLLLLTALFPLQNCPCTSIWVLFS